jgi:PAS domain S-box-containing protein
MLWGALVLALLAAIFVADTFVPANVILSFLYCLALLAAANLHARRWLWGVAAASIVLTLASPFFGVQITPGSHRWAMWINRGLTALILLAICAALDRELVGRARFRRAEAALRESERRFRTMFESAAIGIARVAFEGERWIEVNDTFCRILGRTREEMLSTPWPDMTHPEDIDLDLVPFRRMAEGELDHYAVEKRFICKSGRPLWARLTLSLVRDAEGRPDYEIAVMEDISERKAQEEKLHASEARRNELLATLDLGASLTRDLDDIIRFWSAGCERLYGWTAAEAVGRNAHELLRTLFPEPREAIAAALESEGQWTGDLHQRRRDGAEIIVSAHKALRRDPDGRPVAVLESLADVTMQREAERVLARDKAELERLVEERTSALMRASEEQRRTSEALQQGEKLQALGQLAGGIAHDFNNLLQIVAAGAEILKKGTLAQERRSVVLDGILQAAKNGRELTARLLAFARKQPLRPETIDLNARLNGMAELLRRTLGAGIEVVTDFADDLWPVRVDPSQLEIAVLNLAVNARDAMPEGGKLSLTTRNAVLPPSLEPGADEEFVRLVIRDTGMGMPPSVLSHVFEPFFTTKGPERGTGLGLAQVHGFAKQSDGDVSIDSSPGQGTAITLRLPRARWMREADATAESASAARLRELGQLIERAAGKTVLIVEDTPDVAAFAESLLDDLGYQTRIARGPAEALGVLERGEPVDVLFSDVVMPGDMNGVDLARVVRQRWPDLPIVLASGYSDALSSVEPELRVEMLTKPYVLDELGQALERALNGAGPRETGATVSR